MKPKIQRFRGIRTVKLHGLLLRRAELLAERLDLSLEQVIEEAIELAIARGTTR